MEKEDFRKANKAEAEECFKIQQILIESGINKFNINSVMAVFANWMCDAYYGNKVSKENLQEYIGKVYDRVIEDAKLPNEK